MSREIAEIELLRGPMRLMQGDWSQLDDKDLHAVAAFVEAFSACTRNPASMAGPHAAFVKRPVRTGEEPSQLRRAACTSQPASYCPLLHQESGQAT
jgi:hypothetical protein